MSSFLFATGIENSYPVIADGVRVDEMDKCGHYRHWREDLALVRATGLSHLRWGPALHRTFVRPGVYDWSWVDDVMAEMKRLRITPIVDLCHFGVPDWLGNFQNPEFPAYFAEYASAFAQRYPWIEYWTPINEILITALFSAKYGWWNEMLTSDQAFVRACLNLCRGNLLSMSAINARIPQAVFVQTESCEYTHASRPDLLDAADFHNQRRFLPLDLTYGHELSPVMKTYLDDNGMTVEEFAFFRNCPADFRCVLGVDYYVTNEHMLKPDGTTGPSGEMFGFPTIARQYYERYGLPLMHTETNLWDEQGSAQWLWKQWHGLLHLRQSGIPVLGFTWFSLTDQMDWDTALRQDAHRVNSVGLYDLDRQPRAVGKEYRRLVKDWRAFVNEPMSTWSPAIWPRAA